MEIKGLHFAITADNKDFLQKLLQTRTQINNFSQDVRKSGTSIEEVFANMNSNLSMIGKTVAAAFTFNAAKNFMQQCIDVRKQIQSLSVSFETLLQSKTKADKLISEIRQYAASTPMDVSTLAQGAQTMLGFNIEAEKVMPLLKAIGDISMGDAQKFGSLSLAFSQMSATGKLMGQDLLQMINAGFNPLVQIAEQTGKTVGELKEEMSQGKISVEDVTNAYLSAAGAGGKFNGMLENQAKGIAGSYAYLRGAVADMMNDIGASLQDTVSSGATMAAELVKNYKTVGDILMYVVSAFGAYKAAVMVDSAIASATATINAEAVRAAYASEVEALQAVIPVQEEEAASSLQTAVAKGQLTEAEAAQIAAMRQEAAETVKLMQTKAAEATVTANNARSELVAAEQRRTLAVERVALAQKEYTATLSTGDASKIAAARKNLETASEQANTAAKEVNIAASNLQTATKEKEAATSAVAQAQKNLETASTIANTGAQTVNASATNLLTVAKMKLLTAIRTLYATMMAHPYALLVAAIAALAYGIYKLITYQTEAEKAQEKLNETFAKTQAEVAGEQKSIDLLFDRLRKAKQGTEEYKSAKDAILNQYGKYLNGLINEKNELIDIEAAYLRVSAAARDAANARGLEAATSDAQKTYTEAHEKNMKEIQDILNDEVKDEKLRNTLMELIVRDINRSNKLSEETTKAIADAMGEKGAVWSAGQNKGKIEYSGNTYKILSKVREDAKALELANKTTEEATRRFAVSENKFSEMTLAQLETRRKTLEKAYKTAKEKGTERIDLTINGEVKKAYTSLAEVQLDLQKIQEAYTQKTAEQKAQASKNLATSISAAKKEWQEAKAEYEKIKSNAGNYTIEDYNKAKERFEAAEKAYKNYGGQTDTDKDTKAADERKKAEQKNAEDLLQLKFQNQQSEIDLMQEGSEKKLRQIRLDYEKQKNEIKKKEEELKQANKEAGGKPQLNVEQQAAIEQANKLADDAYNKQLEAQQLAEVQAMRDYLAQYGSFQEQKLAIAQEYAGKIAKAQTEGERLSLTKERDAKLNKIDVQAVENKIDWSTVFSDLTGVMREQLREVLTAVKGFTKTDKFASMSAEDKKTIYDAIQKMQDELPEGSGTLNISSLSAQFSALGDKIKQTQTLYTEMQEKNQQLADAQKGYQDALKSGTDIQKIAAKAWLDVAKNQASQAKEAYEKASTDTQNTATELTDTVKDTTTGLNKVASGLSNFSSGSLKSAYEGLRGVFEGLQKIDLGGAINSIVKKFGDALGNAGTIGSIISAALAVIDVIKDGIGTLMSGLIDTVFHAVNGILDEILNGQFAVKIFDSVKNGIGGLLDTITFGGFSSWFGASGNTKAVKKTTEDLTEANDRLRESIDKLKDEIKESGGWKAIKSATDAEKAQQDVIKNTLDILKAQMGYHGAHHSNSYYWDLSSDDYASINATLAEYARRNGKTASTVNSLEGLYTLTPEEMDYIRTHNIEMWQEIINQGKYDKSEYWNAYADEAGKLQEITDQLKETLTQTSFDSLKDNFISSLLDMDKSAEDFSNDFKEYMMKAVLNAKVSDLLDSELQSFYDKWAEYAKSGNELTSSEQAELQKMYDEIARKGLELRDQVAIITGYQSVTSQSATSGITTSITEETGTEIVGRMTAIQLAVYEQNEAVKSAFEETINIKSLAIARNEYLDNIENNLGLANAYLSQIAKNTGELVQINEKITKIENVVKKL